MQSQDAALVAAGIYPPDDGAAGRRPAPMLLDDRKGGDINEFPTDLQIREWPAQ